MRNIKIIVEYDGANYSGWQRQGGGIKTVQGEIEEAVFKITGEKPPVHGSGRTDAGVHALGQAANFLIWSRISTERLRNALNDKLPADIAVKSADEVPAGFHARRSAKRKTYFYKILNRPARPVIERKTCWFIPYKLDIDSMRAACLCITGEHDFKVFCLSDVSVKTTVRTVFSATMKRDGEFIFFFIEANGFLKRMVRMLVGTLLRVGRGRLSPEGFERILKTGEKTRDVSAAPPRGLFLEKVLY